MPHSPSPSLRPRSRERASVTAYHRRASDRQASQGKPCHLTGSHSRRKCNVRSLRLLA